MRGEPSSYWCNQRRHVSWWKRSKACQCTTDCCTRPRQLQGSRIGDSNISNASSRRRRGHAQHLCKHGSSLQRGVRQPLLGTGHEAPNSCRRESAQRGGGSRGGTVRLDEGARNRQGQSGSTITANTTMRASHGHPQHVVSRVHVSPCQCSQERGVRPDDWRSVAAAGTTGSKVRGLSGGGGDCFDGPRAGGQCPRVETVTQVPVQQRRRRQCQEVFLVPLDGEHEPTPTASASADASAGADGCSGERQRDIQEHRVPLVRVDERAQGGARGLLHGGQRRSSIRDAVGRDHVLGSTRKAASCTTCRQPRAGSS